MCVKHRLRLELEKSIHQGDEGSELSMLVKINVELIVILFALGVL